MRSPACNDRGIALFLVLWILMLLTVIVGEFCHAMRTEVNIVRNFKEEAEAYYIARAGVAIGINELLKLLTRPAAVAPVAGEGEEEPEGPWRINRSMPDFSYGGGSFRIRMMDEGGKVNLNRAGPGLLKAMLSGFELSEEEKEIIVDAIQDWRDSDNFHRLNGAEEDYYQSLPEPYHVRNGDFSSPGELLLVRGITPEMFERGLKDMVTVFPGNPKTPSSPGRKVGSGGAGGKASPRFNYDRVSLNAAPRALLRSLPGMTDELAEALVAFRESTPLRSIVDVTSVLGPDVYAALAPYVTLQDSRVYRIVSIGYPSEGDAGADSDGSGIQRGVRAVVEVAPDPERPYRTLEWLDNLGDDRR